MSKKDTRPVGELTLTLCGCVSMMREAKASGYWEGYFTQKVRFHRDLKPVYLSINWDDISIYLDVKNAYITKGNRAVEEGERL